MATNNQVNVNPVNVMVKTLTTSDLQRDEDEAKKRAAKKAGVVEAPVDSVDLPAKTVGVAAAGTPKAPNSLTSHRKLVNSREALQNALNKAGANISTDDPALAEKAQTFLDQLDQQIAALLEKGGKEDKLATLESQRDEILSTLSDYESIQTETAEGTVTVQASEETGQTNVSTEGPTPEEAQQVFTSIDKDLKTIGVNVSQNETSYELIQNQTAAQFSKDLDNLKTKETELNTQKTALQEKLKTATPEEKKTIDVQLKQIDADLKLVLQQKKDLQVAFVRVNDVLSQAMAASDLGIMVKKDNVETRSAVKTSSSTEPTTKKRSGTVSTSSAVSGSGGSKSSTTATQNTGSSFTLNTASAGNTGGEAALTSGEVDTSAVRSGGLVGTASAEDATTVSGSTNVAGTSAFSDFTGTTLAIASSSSQLKSDARRTDDAIKKLLRAVASGNYEAIKTALVLLDKRASQIVIGMGSATIKAMQNYEQQQGQLSKSLDSLKSDDASYSAKLAQINSQMNVYSMNRQAIANFLQQTMSTREEIGNTTHGFISKDGQIGSALSRW